jgi:hypothetical protein
VRVPEDESDERWTNDEPAPEEPTAAHDDIMKRLLDYQRSLREGASPEEAAEAIRGVAERHEPAETTVATEELVELETPEPEPQAQSSEPEAAVEVELEPMELEPESMELEPEPSPPSAIPESELQARLSALEGKLDLIGSKIVEVRRSFQDLAIAADERLAALEDELERVRGEHRGGA